MALWGKDDNLRSAGTVVVDYAAKTVTGTGTTFTDAAVGDVIRFGVRGGGGVYYGDAVIATITSNTVCSIASTAGLTGAAISGKAYYLSQLPSSSTEDHEFSERIAATGSYTTFKTGTALAAAGIGASVVAVDFKHFGLQIDKNHPDAIVNDGVAKHISALNTGVAVATSPSIVGFKTVFAIAPAGVTATSGAHVVNDGLDIRVVGVAATAITLHSAVTAQINKGATVTFRHTNKMISVGATLSAAIAEGDEINFQRLSGGYDSLVYGIGNGGYEHHKGLSTPYRAENTGWVGVTTYIDCHGELRVKKECLVAMSGITTTGDFGAQGIVYPTSEG